MGKDDEDDGWDGHGEDMANERTAKNDNANETRLTIEPTGMAHQRIVHKVLCQVLGPPVSQIPWQQSDLVAVLVVEVHGADLGVEGVLAHVIAAHPLDVHLLPRHLVMLAALVQVDVVVVGDIGVVVGLSLIHI